MLSGALNASFRHLGRASFDQLTPYQVKLGLNKVEVPI